MGNVTAFTKYKKPRICCFQGISVLVLLGNPRIKLISCEGNTKVLKGRTKIKAGEIMFKFPDCVVCHADSFILGRPIPVLAIHDHLVAGHTYFIIPLDRLPRGGPPLSAASLQYLSSPSSSGNNSSPSSTITCTNNNVASNNHCNLFSGGNDQNGNKSPFEYIKDKDGRVLMIKVVPEFITRIITADCNSNSNSNTNTNSNSNSPSNINNNLICTTPELQKQYQQLVRAKDQGWSPKLETISEHKNRSSPSKLLRLEWIPIKQKLI